MAILVERVPRKRARGLTQLNCGMTPPAFSASFVALKRHGAAPHARSRSTPVTCPHALRPPRWLCTPLHPGYLTKVHGWAPSSQDLKAELAKRGLPQTGNKPELVARLEEAMKQDAAGAPAAAAAAPAAAAPTAAAAAGAPAQLQAAKAARTPIPTPGAAAPAAAAAAPAAAAAAAAPAPAAAPAAQPPAAQPSGRTIVFNKVCLYIQ